MDERRLAAFITVSMRPYPAKADVMVARMREILSDKAALEAPFGPFTGEARTRLQRAAEKSGKPGFFIAFIMAKGEIHQNFTQMVFGNAERTNVFINELESSISNRPLCRDKDGKPVEMPLSDASIITKIVLALQAALSTSGIAASEGRKRALRELDPLEMDGGVSGPDIKLRE